MKKFNLFCREDSESNDIATYIKAKLKSAGLIYDVNKPDLVISVGGDGTMLKAIHNYIDNLSEMFFCGVHTGTLGFYTDFRKDEVDELIEKIISNTYYEVSFNLLCINLKTKLSEKNLYALNEGRIENNQHTQVLDVYVDNKYFETYRGNGLNFATPTGSTGYNKSLGGAVVHPKTKALQMCEIAPINNINYRPLSSPLILGKSHYVMIKMDKYDGAILGFDSFSIDLEKNYKDIESITFNLSDKCVRFARFKTYAFMDRVKRNFIFDDI